MAERGRTAEGIALIREGIDHFAGRGTSIVPWIALSEAQARAHRMDEAILTIERALSAGGEQRINLLRARWRRAELLLARGDATRAVDDFHEVIEAARRAQSKAYELRATTSLARVLARQGKVEDARAMLIEVYGWFTEGLDTADLKDAQALLAELGS
jgi:adenylate cyclase